jgi:hypothetical protein
MFTCDFDRETPTEVSAGSALMSCAGQTWRALLALSHGPDEKLDQSELACLAWILASFAARLIPGATRSLRRVFF